MVLFVLYAGKLRITPDFDKFKNICTRCPQNQSSRRRVTNLCTYDKKKMIAWKEE